MLVWLSLLLLVPAQVVSDEQPRDTLIVLQMGACERRCPVYRLMLFADGSTVLDGRHYVRVPGLFRSKMKLDSIAKLIAQAEAIRFFDLKNSYEPGGDCESPKSDAPAAVLTISSRGRAKTIQHFRGCAGREADQLKQLEDAIVDASGIGKRIR